MSFPFLIIAVCIAEISLLSTKECISAFNISNFSLENPSKSGGEVSKSDWAFSRNPNRNRIVFKDNFKEFLCNKMGGFNFFKNYEKKMKRFQYFI